MLLEVFQILENITFFFIIIIIFFSWVPLVSKIKTLIEIWVKYYLALVFFYKALQINKCYVLAF
jgi:hypothetical protein